MKNFLKNFYRILRGGQLIIKSTFQTRIFRIGLYLLFRFYNDILFIFLINKIRYNKINYSFKKYCDRNFKLSYNWFGSNAQIWFFVFKKFNILKKKLNILEIGTFEGRSAAFYYKYLNVNLLTTVDFMDKKSTSFKNFKFNSKKFINCNFYNLKSNDFFYKNKSKIRYDLVYIDGSHYYKDVLNDAINSFKLLKKNGLIIFDDFLYIRQTTRLKHPEYKNVIGGILYFLKKKKVKIIYVGHQVIIKKLNN